MKRTLYVIDGNGRSWLPPHKSRLAGWARHSWFREATGVEGNTASEEHWQELTAKHRCLELVEMEDGTLVSYEVKEIV